MNIRSITLASTLLLVCTSHAADADPSQFTTGTAADESLGMDYRDAGDAELRFAHLFGKRLVGLWSTDIHVSVEACSPGAPEPPLLGRNTMVFSDGGTLVENPQVSPPGIPGAPVLRTFGLGRWSYDWRSREYAVLVRFDWYSSSNGAYQGYSEVDRSITLSNDHNTASGPVIATRYAADGSVLGQLCGHAISTRL